MAFVKEYFNIIIFCDNEMKIVKKKCIKNFFFIGRDWLWDPDNREIDYLKILRMFEDKRSAPYSIHQIALMGVSHGKQVGEWFGPNTIAQVLK